MEIRLGLVIKQNFKGGIISFQNRQRNKQEHIMKIEIMMVVKYAGRNVMK